MHVKKTKGKKIYGADLSPDEQKAMEIEIRKQLAEFEEGHSEEMDALILLMLHKHFGFGPVRLKRFYMAFGKHVQDLISSYREDEVGKSELWVSAKRLKEYGVDLQEWKKERDKNGYY